MKEVLVFGIILIIISIIGEIYLKRKFSINWKKQERSLSYKRIEFVGTLKYGYWKFSARSSSVPYILCYWCIQGCSHYESPDKNRDRAIDQ